MPAAQLWTGKEGVKSDDHPLYPLNGDEKYLNAVIRAFRKYCELKQNNFGSLIQKIYNLRSFKNLDLCSSNNIAKLQRNASTSSRIDGYIELKEDQLKSN